jgi:hypothetical protein
LHFTTVTGGRRISRCGAWSTKNALPAAAVATPYFIAGQEFSRQNGSMPPMSLRERAIDRCFVFVHMTNKRDRLEADFEKDSAAGAEESLQVIYNRCRLVA